MSKLRNPDYDKFKSPAIRKEQFKYRPVCRLEDCSNPLTMYEGPGSDSYCRDHQLQLTEYGGMGKADRPHTFYRNWVCADCKYDPRIDPSFDDIEDEFHKLACMRATLEGDHQHLQQQGGKDVAENIVTRCCRCHRIKTMKNKDYLKKKILTDE
jgi:hypothetical protein